MTDLGVLIVDDDFRVAALHSAIVDAVRGFRVVARAGSVAAAREAIADHPEVDLALLDVYLPDGSGIDLISELPCDCFIVGAETDAAAVREPDRLVECMRLSFDEIIGTPGITQVFAGPAKP